MQNQSSNKAMQSAPESKSEAPRALFSFWFEGKNGQAGFYIDAHSQEEAQAIYDKTN